MWPTRSTFLWRTMVVLTVGIPAAPSLAQATQDLAGEVNELRQELTAQRALIQEQSEVIEEQQRRLDILVNQVRDAEVLDQARARGSATNFPVNQEVTERPTAGPLPTVGEAPPEVQTVAQVTAVPQGQGVLTPAGALVFEPTFEYTRSSTNRLVFRGIELIPGIQIGLIEATDADRDTLSATAAFRYGLTDRLELEGRIPFLYRSDRIEVVQQREDSIVRELRLQEEGLGDVEVGLRYQFNRARPLRPIFVGTLRVKSDTGISPFEIPFDEFGVATGLATGSGFWGVQPGLSFLLPSDPAVLFGGISYLYHIPKDIDRVIGDVLIGRVDPGDAISANVGFGFALNPRFSYSLGYRHSYLFPTETEIGTTLQRSNHLQVGSFNMGLSYRLTEREALNLGFEFGVTEDAPDVSIVVRVPYSF